LLLHSSPVPQLGEQAGGWHKPFSHTCARQSESSPQGAPWLQFGEQRGGPQVFVAPVHTNEEQLPLSEQAAPGAQCGEQAGG
jgi:hypothetical protein